MGAAEEVESILRAEELQDRKLAAPDWARKPRRLRVPWAEPKRRKPKTVSRQRVRAMEFCRVTRVAKRLSQRDLAEMSGVSQSTIGMAEAGHHVPQWRTLQKLGDVLGVTHSELRGETPEPEEVLTQAVLREMELGKLGAKEGLDLLVDAGVFSRVQRGATDPGGAICDNDPGQKEDDQE